MKDLNVTASAIISFAEELEDSSSKFYEDLAERFAEERGRFLAFAKESKRNKTLVVRTYQETITDALEACFSFEGLDLKEYAVHTTLAEDTSHFDVLGIAIELEEKACKFYSDIAGRSESLLATIPRAFRRVAEKRSKRRLELQSLRDKTPTGS